MKTILFTNVRDEIHIREWAIHHLHLGFNQIIIFDHLSIDPVKDIVSDLPNVKVERLNVPFANKIRLMDCSLQYSNKKGYDWVMYLDGDEFLYLKNHDTIQEFLADYEGVDQIGINWLMFGSNHLDNINNVDNVDKSIFQLYTKSEPLLNEHVKSIVKTSMAVKAGHPHFYFTTKNAISTGWDREPYYGPFHKDKFGMKKENATAYIAHYYCQSYETYLSRKVKRTRDDIPEGKWDVMKKDKFHQTYNDVENTDLTKYKYDNIWINNQKNQNEKNNQNIPKNIQNIPKNVQNVQNNQNNQNQKNEKNEKIVMPRINYYMNMSMNMRKKM